MSQFYKREFYNKDIANGETVGCLEALQSTEILDDRICYREPNEFEG